MKKILFITALFCVGVSYTIFAQCIPDATYESAGVPGLFPTTIEGIASGLEGTPYSQLFTVIVPADTTVEIPLLGTQTATINSASVTGITGLPSGLTHTCTPTSCLWPGDSNGCFVVDGTPAAAGTFAVVISTSVEVSYMGFDYSFPQDVTYSLTIDSTWTGIQDIEQHVFEVYPITPNPSNKGAEIRFTLPEDRDVSLTVHNMIGALVVSSQIYSKKGMNIVSLASYKLRSGVYLITLTDGQSISTKRMVVESR